MRVDLTELQLKEWLHAKCRRKTDNAEVQKSASGL